VKEGLTEGKAVGAADGAVDGSLVFCREGRGARGSQCWDQRGERSRPGMLGAELESRRERQLV
jgi:hypothetical protein